MLSWEVSWHNPISEGVSAVQDLHMSSLSLELSWGNLQKCPGAMMLFSLGWAFPSGFSSLATDVAW